MGLILMVGSKKQDYGNGRVSDNQDYGAKDVASARFPEELLFGEHGERVSVSVDRESEKPLVIGFERVGPSYKLRLTDDEAFALGAFFCYVSRGERTVSRERVDLAVENVLQEVHGGHHVDDFIPEVGEFVRIVAREAVERVFESPVLEVEGDE